MWIFISKAFTLNKGEAMKRQDLRKYAFLITFGRSISFDSPEEALANFLETFRDDYEKENGKFSKNNLEFVKDIIFGIHKNIEVIDETIVKYAKGYTLERISKVALAALRVSIYEILFREDIPNKVSVNEAVEIVKTYEGEETKKFVNGILGNMLRTEEK
ncbi:MAG: transcription antitermination factor NusB [Ruminococcaceae bacterium]|nr:transcription antitermination factor NusB [Oscillospiraceae bacterium]